MKFLINCIFISFFILLLFSCKKNGDKMLTRRVLEWQNKEIIFPDSMIFTRYITDTVDYKITSLQPKILIYADSIGCIGCKLKLNRWKQFMQEVDSITGNSVSFLFFLHPNNIRELKSLLKKEEFDYPICVDKKNIINKINNFPSLHEYQTFLIDKNNKVVFIGNPIDNIALKELYIRELMKYQ